MAAHTGSRQLRKVRVKHKNISSNSIDSDIEHDRLLTYAPLLQIQKQPAVAYVSPLGIYTKSIYCRIMAGYSSANVRLSLNFYHIYIFTLIAQSDNANYIIFKSSYQFQYITNIFLSSIVIQ